MSDLFDWLLPAGVLVGIAALLMALLIPKMRRSTFVAAGTSLLLLAEPAAYLTILWLIPSVRYGQFGAEVVAWVVFVVLPLALPLSALRIMNRRRFESASYEGS